MTSIVVGKDRISLVESERYVAGTAAVYVMKVAFSEDWEGLEKHVIFRTNEFDIALEVLSCSEQFPIPSQIFAQPTSRLQIGVYGSKCDEKVLNTRWLSLGRVVSGTIDSLCGCHTPAIPSPDTYKILRQLIDRKADRLTYEDGQFKLWAGADLLSSFDAPGADISDEMIEEKVENAVGKVVETKVDEKIDEALGTNLDEKIGSMVDTKVETAFNTELPGKVGPIVDSKIDQKLEDSLDSKVGPIVDSKLDEKIGPAIDSKVGPIIDEKVATVFNTELESKVEPIVNKKVDEALGEGLDAKVESIVEDKIGEIIDDKVADKADKSMVHGIESRLADKADRSTVESLESQLNNKVDKEGDKVLSEKDFTAAYEEKLNGLTNYTLPPTSETVLGGVKMEVVTSSPYSEKGKRGVKALEDGTALVDWAELPTDESLSNEEGKLKVNSVSWSQVRDKPDLVTKEDMVKVYIYAGSVETYDSLPEGFGTEDRGKTYNVIDSGLNYAWLGIGEEGADTKGWDSLGGSFKIETITDEEIDALFEELEMA